MVLNSLGGMLQRLGKFQEAADALQRSLEISEQMGDQRGVAMVLNSLGGVLQRLGKFEEAADAFSSSIALGEKLHDKMHLAKAHTSYGKALVSRRELKSAAEHLRQGFNLDEEARNQRGIVIVTPVLVAALRRLGSECEAGEIVQRALAIAPDSDTIQRLTTRQEGDGETASAAELLVSGRIKRILAPLGRTRYGFLTRDDDGTDAFFSEERIGESLFSRLAPGMAVQAGIVRGPRGWVAHSLELVSRGDQSAATVASGQK
jgi:tetratricopeptide (TPR) repeat protein